jgi:hypothetical protein
MGLYGGYVIMEYWDVSSCLAVRPKHLSIFNFRRDAMKKFIPKIIIFFLPVVIVLCILEMLLQIIPNDYKYKRDQLLKNAKDIEVLILGSSHTYYGINPDYLTLRGFNLANGSQSLELDYSLLETYGSNLDNLKIVVVPVSYFSLYYELALWSESWRIKNYVLYYHIKYPFSIKNNFELLNSTVISNLYRLYQYITDRDSPIAVSDAGFRLSGTSTVDNDLEKTGRDRALAHTGFYDTERFFYNQKMIKNIIEWCNKRNITLIFVTAPAYYTYRDNLDKVQLNETINYMVNIGKENNNVYYYNFLEDNDFIADDFFDADHLNEIGAKKFTKKIDRIIINYSNFAH